MIPVGLNFLFSQLRYGVTGMDARLLPENWRIPDDLWEAIQQCLPKHHNRHRFGGGRPRTPDRVCMEAILFVLRTGCQWKALDATRFCPGSAAHDRFQLWVEADSLPEYTAMMHKNEEGEEVIHFLRRNLLSTKDPRYESPRNPRRRISRGIASKSIKFVEPAE